MVWTERITDHINHPHHNNMSPCIIKPTVMQTEDNARNNFSVTLTVTHLMFYLCLGLFKHRQILDLLRPVNREGSHQGGSQCISISQVKIMILNHCPPNCLVTLPCTINETLKWLTSLPILMRKSLWW